MIARRVVWPAYIAAALLLAVFVTSAGPLRWLGHYPWRRAVETPPRRGVLSVLARGMAWGSYAALTILLVTVIAWLTLPRLMGWQAQVVLSGSMEPAMLTGSVAFVQPIEPEQLDVGDIISFYHPEKTSKVVTHRLAAIVRQDGNLVFQTRGDANDGVDPWLIPAADVIGTVRFSVPYTGYVTQRLRSPLGFALLVGIPAAVIIVGELRNIAGQLRRRNEDSP